jgi:glucose/arabinose dehydrogenase
MSSSSSLWLRVSAAGALAWFGSLVPGALLGAEQQFEIVTVAEGLEDPWAIAVLPNGDVLVTEKAGRLRLIRDGRLQPEPVEGVPQVRVGGQGGLMDLKLAPDFETSRWVYMTISKPNADDSLGTTALVRGRFDGVRLTDLEEVIETKAWGEARAHYGSRLAFDASGHVFLSIPPSSSITTSAKSCV